MARLIDVWVVLSGWIVICHRDGNPMLADLF
jgi:hypothetical protein